MILAIPDRGKPAITINQSHGPSWWDMPGIVLVALSWIVMSVHTLANWSSIIRHIGRQKTTGLVLLYAFGLSVIFYGLKAENDLMLWCGVGLAFVSNAILTFISYKKI